MMLDTIQHWVDRMLHRTVDTGLSPEECRAINSRTAAVKNALQQVDRVSRRAESVKQTVDATESAALQEEWRVIQAQHAWQRQREAQERIRHDGV